MNMERFQGALIRFAEHLRNRGEETAAQAVETILKSLNRGIFNDSKRHTVPADLPETK